MSKELEALECLKVLEDCASVCGDYSHRVEPIKQALIKAQEQEKVLNVIFKKPLKSATTINYLKINQIFPDMLDYEHYCLTVKEKIRNTEEEFDLLKEVLQDETN